MLALLDRLGRNLHHLVNLVHDLTKLEALKVGEGSSIDTTTANGRLMFGFFAALAEFEHELIVERTRRAPVGGTATGAKDEFLLAAAAQNLRKLVRSAKRHFLCCVRVKGATKTSRTKLEARDRSVAMSVVPPRTIAIPLQ